MVSGKLWFEGSEKVRVGLEILGVDLGDIWGFFCSTV